MSWADGSLAGARARATPLTATQSGEFRADTGVGDSVTNPNHLYAKASHLTPEDLRRLRARYSGSRAVMRAVQQWSSTGKNLSGR